jgi:hypothetical protein
MPCGVNIMGLMVPDELSLSSGEINRSGAALVMLIVYWFS